MTKAQTRKSGGAKKIGRSAQKPSHLRYNAQGRRDANKRKRIEQSNGKKFLAQWESRIRRTK